MKFIPNGPDIPESLLQAHEDGKVVFFCGAGISYKVGLGNFKWFVDEIYRTCNTFPESAEEKACGKALYDTALNILEKRLPGQRRGMRKSLVQILQPNMDPPDAKDTHLALLQLARSRDGDLRLVTTNFDRAFEKVAKIEKLNYQTYSAPMLPIPKRSQWDGLVYLHGLIPKDESDKVALDRLVMTSGDFGLAYLTDRWAARFVSELFRNFIVCFIGYSINDPVIRYMTDAIAADRLRGESTNKFYTFDSGNNKADKLTEWEARDIIPILYDSADNHELLHETIKMWAEYYRDGIGGKERIVTECAGVKYVKSTKQDNLRARMLWAISDKSGLPAQKFASFNPAPSLMWLKVFDNCDFDLGDLIRFGVHSAPDARNIQKFSLMRRPAPYELAPYMELVSSHGTSCDLDDVMKSLGQWLVRHLNDPTLLLWIARNGGRLHKFFANLIEQRLNEYQCLERDGFTDKFDGILINSPNAIPNRFMKKLWHLLLVGQVFTDHSSSRDLYVWENRFDRDGLTTPLRVELRRLLAPRIKLSSPLLGGNSGNPLREPERMRDFVDYELELFTNHARLTLGPVKSTLVEAEPFKLLQDFQQLLLDALDLLHELEGDNKDSDLSYLYLPSIAPHPQNDKHSTNWVVLIELLRDAWLEILRINADHASRIAQSWFDFPYATFKRLALFAASQDDCIAPIIWTNWVIQNDSWWLWSIYTHRESMRLLVTQARILSEIQLRKLEEAILKGPPREMDLAGVDSEKWDEYVRISIRICLSKLAYSENILGADALATIHDESSGVASWKEWRDNERNEFALWLGGTVAPDIKEFRKLDFAPSDKYELVERLKRELSQKSQTHGDYWQEVCRTRFDDSIFALSKLSSEGRWPTGRWSEALHAWSNEKSNDKSWEDVIQLLQRMPNETFEEISRSIAWWLESSSETIDGNDAEVFEICNRILNAPHNGVAIGYRLGYVAEAINHPVGLVTTALLNIWFNQNPTDNELIPSEFKIIFTRICDTKTPSFRYGRVVLASRLVPLYRADQIWVRENLFSFLDWSDNPTEAMAAWAGFLWSPRLYSPLLVEIKQHFLKTANHYSNLDECKQQYAELFTGIGLGHVAEYSEQDFQKALKELPEDGLQIVARTLYRTLDSSGSQRKEYWSNRTKPFLQKLWPQSKNLASEKIAEEFATIAIAAGSKFDEALGVVSDWLQPLDSPARVIQILGESEFLKQFPMESLHLLNAIISNDSRDLYDLRDFLCRILEVSPSLTEEPEYQKLEQISRRHR